MKKYGLKHFIVPIITAIFLLSFIYFYTGKQYFECKEQGGKSVGYYGKICVKDGIIINY